MRDAPQILKDIEEALERMNPIEMAIFCREIGLRLQKALKAHTKNFMAHQAKSFVDEMLERL